MNWAHEQRLDTLPIGEIMVRIGQRFLGTPYAAGTLDRPGPERLVIDLHGLDCVTFVESTLALSRTVRAGKTELADFARELEHIRYRDGVADGYPSRLHYFSDWIATNQTKGLVRDMTQALGGEPDRRPIDFMSAHADLYPHLADTANLRAIRATEAELNGRTRYRIPAEAIAAAAPGIRNGDIIAATSSVTGLDVAHTGIALLVDGQVHLLHAPLAGGVVEISPLPLAERIPRQARQDGIMVARPQ